MSKTGTSRGNTTRQANKELRRKRILDVTRNLIADKGFEAFTLAELAIGAEVSVPTIHNLFGKKYDIFQELCGEMVVRVEGVLQDPGIEDPIEAAEEFIDQLLVLFSNDEAFYRAAFVAGERTKLFEHESSQGIFHRSLKIAEQLCSTAVKNNLLNGNIRSKELAEQLFGCQRLARQDWVNGYIDLKQYRKQVLLGMYLTYAADATPKFHQQLLEAINTLRE